MAVYAKSPFHSNPQSGRSAIFSDRRPEGLLGGVVLRAEEVQRDVRFIAHYPAIVTGRPRWDVEEHAGAEFVDRAIIHGSGGTAREHQANMLNVAARCPYAWPNMKRPLPAGLIGGAADGHAPDANQFELSFFERSNLVWLLETLQDYVHHRDVLARAR